MSGRPSSTSSSMKVHASDDTPQCNNTQSSDTRTEPTEPAAGISESLENLHLDRNTDSSQLQEACACIGSQFSADPPLLMDIDRDLELIE
ncbi:hypothetical protein PT974_04048 [Cladobotryum mycophilum]|uniref:Uncharacterized protein n=1 Tax=Cladobotryum mycophilum TaxID=491253 RepID=A0ABR0SU04_9HYPO